MSKSILKLAAVCAALAAATAVAFASDYPLGPLPGLPEERTAPQACLDYCAVKEQCSVGWPSVTVESPYPLSSSWPDGCTSYCLAVCSPLAGDRPDTGLRIGLQDDGKLEGRYFKPTALEPGDDVR